MIDTETLYRSNMLLLEAAGIEFQEYDHEQVLSYKQARAVKEQFSLTGVESKSLFLKLKDGRYCMFVSIEGARFDPKRIRNLLGSKPSICTEEELSAITGCVPKCACPFGLPEDIILMVDEKIYHYEHFLYSPGPPDKTIQIRTDDIHEILKKSPNQVVSYVETQP